MQAGLKAPRTVTSVVRERGASALLDAQHGFCLFARPPVFADPQLAVDLINGLRGWGWTTENLERLSITALQDELEFNRRVGFTEADARLPEYMTVEPLPPHNTVFDVPDGDADSVFAGL